MSEPKGRMRVDREKAARDAVEQQIESNGGMEGMMSEIFGGMFSGGFNLSGLFRPMSEEDREQRERERLVRNAVEAKSSVLNKWALVTYRCKSHGCLLGALVQVQGRRYQLWRQNTEVGQIDAEDIERWVETGDTGDVDPGLAEQIMDEVVTRYEDYEKDGQFPDEVVDWHPGSLSEWLQATTWVDGVKGLQLHCRELRQDSIGWWGYGDNMNCRHVEHSLRDGEAESDAKRLRRQKKRVVQVDSRGPVRPGK